MGLLTGEFMGWNKNGKATVEAPRKLFGPGGLMEESARQEQERQDYKPPAKPRLDQIANLLHQLTYTEMMELDGQLGVLYVGMTGNDQKEYVEGSFAKMLSQWTEANRCHQISSRLELEYHPEPLDN